MTLLDVFMAQHSREQQRRADLRRHNPEAAANVLVLEEMERRAIAREIGAPDEDESLRQWALRCAYSSPARA